MSDKPMTAERLQEIRDRANDATEGPWGTDLIEGDVALIKSRDPVQVHQGSEYVGQIWTSDDAEFVSNSRVDISDLWDEVDRLRGVLREIRELADSDPDDLVDAEELRTILEKAMSHDT